MTFTLAKLAVALRGMPRDARFLIQLPNGTLADLDHLRPSFVSAHDDGTLEARTASQGTDYGIGPKNQVNGAARSAVVR